MESPMTVKELSEYLRLDRMTIYKMLKEGDIPASRIGRQWRFFRSDIDQWIRSLRIGQQASVLVVDSDALARQMFEEELSIGSFDVVLAVNGDEALSLASQRPIRPRISGAKKGHVWEPLESFARWTRLFP